MMYYCHRHNYASRYAVGLAAHLSVEHDVADAERSGSIWDKYTWVMYKHLNHQSPLNALIANPVSGERTGEDMT